MQHKVLIWILLSLVWTVYVVWEFQVQKWIKMGTYELTRFDLILLPPLLAVTGSILYITTKSEEKE